jgi:hypothetical protein
VRVKVSTLVVAGGAVAGLATLAFVLFRGSPGPAAASFTTSGESDTRVPAVGRRARSLPRFHTSAEAPEARPAPPTFVQPPPPEFTTPPKTEREQLKERASKDGYLFREDGSETIYVVQGGSKFAVPNREEFEALGYKWDQVEVVQRGTLGFLRERPNERTLFRERDSRAVYYYENGQKRGITSPEAFERLGHKWSDIKTVPSGTLKNETVGAPLQ